MKTTLKTLAAASVLAVATFGTAQANGPQGYGYVTVQPGHAYGHGVRQHPLAGLREINARQEEQRARIEHGFHRGAITRFEFRRLMAEQHDIQGMERAFVSDGFLSPRERGELHRRLDFASQHIIHEARDHQRRF
ncbi:MAG: hypothetical protein ABL891_19740 [Burkholderiales bacterium]